jgi:hypothetical protein
VRVVVVSDHPAAALKALRSKLVGCRPVAVGAAEDVLAELRPGTSILLELDDAATGAATARRLRDIGVTNGIVVVGTTAVAGLDDVAGLAPPIRLADLTAALQRVQEASDRAELPIGPIDLLSSELANVAGAIEGSDAEDRAAEELPVIDLAGHEATDDEVLGQPVAEYQQLPPGPLPFGWAEDTTTGLLTRFRTAMRRQREAGPEPYSSNGAAAAGSEAPSILEDGILPSLAAVQQLARSMQLFPILQDVQACAEAVLDEVSGGLGPDVQAVAIAMRAADEVFEIVACEGLTPMQAQFRVALGHPFVTQIREAGGGLLVTPAADAPGLVSGLPVAASETVLGTVVGDHEVEALVLVGQAGAGRPADLDALGRVTDESASLLAFAAALRRLYLPRPALRT